MRVRAGVGPGLPAGESGHRKRRPGAAGAGGLGRAGRAWRLRAATDAFHFGGFLPHKPGQRAKALEALRRRSHAGFYEAPHRILEALEAIGSALRPISAAVPAQKLLMQLGQFGATTTGRGPALLDGLQCLQNPVRRLVENQRGFFGASASNALPLARLVRQKPAEVECVGGQPGGGQRGQHGEAPGTGCTGTPLSMAAFTSRSPGPTPARTRIGHQRHYRPRAQPPASSSLRPAFVVVVVAMAGLSMP